MAQEKEWNQIEHEHMKKDEEKEIAKQYIKFLQEQMKKEKDDKIFSTLIIDIQKKTIFL